MQKIFITLLIIFIAIPLMTTSCSRTDNTEVKQACIDAALSGIKLDIQRLKAYLLQQDLENRQEVESAYKKLEEDLKKYSNMKAEEYELPKPIKIKGYLGESYVPDSIIYLEQQNKSGPFYHAVKIMKNRGSEIVPKEVYTFTVYPVYKRYYPFESWYVFVSDFKK